MLTVLIFDPFFFIFVDIDHQKWTEKWTEKWELWTHPPWSFEKWDQKWVKNGTVYFSAPQQPWTLHLTAGPALSYHFPNAFCRPSVSLKSSLSLYWLVFSPLKVFYLNFFSCSIMWMVNKMRWLPYGATTKRTDNAETLFSNLKNWRQKMDEKWMFFSHFSPHFWLHFSSYFSEKWNQKWDQKWIKKVNCEHP